MRRREACKFHLLGRCRYGDECRYSHAADATRPLCIYFLQGFCRNGQSCPFAHALDDAYVDNVEAQIQSEGSLPDAPQQRQVDSAEHTAAASGAHPGPPALDAATTTLAELTHCSLCKYKGAAPEDLANHLRGKHPAAITQLRQLQAHRQCPKCSESFDAFQHLSNHLRFEHTRLASYHQVMEYVLRDLHALEMADLLEEEEERCDNWGFTADEVDELLCQGVKPWDDDAWDVMNFLSNPY